MRAHVQGAAPAAGSSTHGDTFDDDMTYVCLYSRQEEPSAASVPIVFLFLVNSQK